MNFEQIYKTANNIKESEDLFKKVLSESEDTENEETDDLEDKEETATEVVDSEKEDEVSEEETTEEDDKESSKEVAVTDSKEVVPTSKTDVGYAMEWKNIQTSVNDINNEFKALQNDPIFANTAVNNEALKQVSEDIGGMLLGASFYGAKLLHAINFIFPSATALTNPAAHLLAPLSLGGKYLTDKGDGRKFDARQLKPATTAPKSFAQTSSQVQKQKVVTA